MLLTSDELLQHLHTTDAILADAAILQGADPVAFEPEREACLRRLDGPARSLRALLEGDAITVLGDAIDAARAVLSDPDAGIAGLGQLEAARNTLNAVIHRQAERLRIAAAA
jgi:hypothetical protein